MLMLNKMQNVTLLVLVCIISYGAGDLNEYNLTGFPSYKMLNKYEGGIT